MSDQPPAKPDSAPPLRAWLTVFILTLFYGVGTLDRQMMALLVGPIKHDLGFSEMEIGALQGVAFALFFVLASLPIGWLVDRVSRRAVVFWGTLVWSLCAALSGLANSFGQMFAARAGLGAGEATIQPSAFATIADNFPAERLALPMSVFVIGANIGAGLSFIFGGLVVEWASGEGGTGLPVLGGLEPWRQAFILTGLPGLVLAFLAFTLPRSRTVARRDEQQDGDFTLAWRQYRANWRFYVLHNLAFASCIAFIVGLLAWNPAFLGRQYGWQPGEIGLWLGSTQIAFSVPALILHGWAVDWMFKRGVHDAHLRWFAVLCPLAGLLGCAAYLVSNVWLMLLLFNAALFCVVAYPGIAAAALQIATPPEMRGKISSVYLIGLNLLGALSGPMIVAAITQYGFADDARVGWSMSIFAACMMSLATLFCLLGRAPMRAAIAARSWDCA